MLSKALVLACIVRSATLFLPHTFFQPDEFYQAFEPAYTCVFGGGYLTWEWRDLPVPLDAPPNNWWTSTIVGGRLRGWIWPGVFMLVYRLVRSVGWEETDLIALAPRAVGVVIAALTDYYTYILAAKVLGPGAAPAALFLSLTSLFNGHLLLRALSTSPETLLTTVALCYYPLPARSVVDPRPGNSSATASPDGGRGRPSKPIPVSNDGKEALNYVALDTVERCDKISVPKDNLILAAALAALSLSIRPTMLVFWAYIHLEQSLHTWRTRGISGLTGLSLGTLTGGVTVLLIATAIDWVMVGRLTLPLVTFFYQNVVLNIASFYGGTGILYHVVQSLPILMFPVWYWWGHGFAAALCPSLSSVETTAPLRTLARAITFSIALLSLSPHSEWRFLHPLLPQLLLFVIPPLIRQYTPDMAAGRRFTQAARQYCRLPRRPFYLILLSPIIPYLYLNIFHGAGQVSAINALRRGEFGTTEKVVALMPCHSTPWASHLGQVDGWFLSCEPPLAGIDPSQHRTEQDQFYASPVSYILDVFPTRPLPSSSSAETDSLLPSHIILFGCLLDVTQAVGQEMFSVRQSLASRGYHEARHFWNGFDIAQDEEKRRGGVRVWVRN